LKKAIQGLATVSLVILVLGVPWISRSLVLNLVWEIWMAVATYVLLVGYVRDSRRRARRARRLN
jgi:hypothetical protein